MNAAADLHLAVRDLLEPKRHRIVRDTGKRQHVQVPSLWDQLVDAVATGKESMTGGAFGSRPPAAIDILDLRAEIVEVTVDALQGHDQAPRIALPDNLRLLAATIANIGDDDLTDWWTYRVESWVRRVQRTLGLTDDPQPRRIRDTACPACNATHVQAVIDGERQQVPALVIDFAGRMVRAAQCDACGATWWRGDELHDLAHQIGVCTLCDTPEESDLIVESGERSGSVVTARNTCL